MSDLKSLSRRQVLHAGGVLSLLAALPATAKNVLNLAHSEGQLPDVPFETLALARLSFGPRPSDFAEWQRLSPKPEKRLSEWLDRQLKPSSIADKACEQKINALRLTTLSKPMAQLWKDHFVTSEEMKGQEKEKEKEKEKQIREDLRRQPAIETEIATWIRAVHSERQLQEVMVNFWHNHFNIFAWEPKIASTFVQYDRDVIRKHVFGNFREMLEDVAQSPAMLLYLDNGINQSGNPNENYARELFELHTLGAENYLGTRDRGSVPKSGGLPVGYVDGDVYEAARCFTGWRIDEGGKSNNTGTFDYFDQWHDRFQKVVLGKPLKEYQPPLKDGRDVLDLLASHPGTAHFIARKLCRQFVADQPSDALVDKIAKVFNDHHKSKDQIQQVIKAVALSDEFKSARHLKLTRPFEATVGFLRATQASFTPSTAFLHNFEATGRKLFSWRTPDGYPERGDRWLGANVLFERWRLMNQILLGKIEGVQVDLKNFATTDDFISQLEREVLFRPLSKATQQAIESFLQSNSKRPRRFIFATGLAFMSPEMQWS